MKIYFIINTQIYDIEYVDTEYDYYGEKRVWKKPTRVNPRTVSASEALNQGFTIRSNDFQYYYDLEHAKRALAQVKGKNRRYEVTESDLAHLVIAEVDLGTCTPTVVG